MWCALRAARYPPTTTPTRVIPVDRAADRKPRYRHQRHHGRDIELEPVHGVDIGHPRRGQKCQQQDTQPGIEEPAIDAGRREEHHEQPAAHQLHAAPAAAARRDKAVDLGAKGKQQDGKAHQPGHDQPELLVRYHQQQLRPDIAKQSRHHAIKHQQMLIRPHGVPIAGGAADIAGQGGIGIGRIGQHRWHTYCQ